MTHKELLYVTTIAEHQSITKAAQSLYIAQPSLSQTVAKIEEELGQKLFIRLNSGLELTEYGKKYVLAAQKILKLYKDLEDELTQYNHLQKGKIVFGIGNNLATYILPILLTRFAELYPNIEVVFKENNSFELERLLLSGKIDFAIMHLQEDNDCINYEILKEDPFFLVVPIDHPINQKYDFKTQKYPLVDLLDFANEHFIMVTPHQRSRQVGESILKKAGISPKMKYTTKNMETAKRLVRSKNGVTLLPKSYMNLFSGEEGLRYYYLPKNLDAKWLLTIASTKSSKFSKADLEFIRILKEVLK